MTVIISTEVPLDPDAAPLTCPRIVHSNSWLSDGDVVANDAASGFYADAPNNSKPLERFSPQILPAFWGKSFSGNRSFNYLAITGHNFGTAGVRFQWQSGDGLGNFTNLLPNDSANPGVLVADDTPILVLHGTVAAPEMRIRMPVGPVDMPVVAMIRFGLIEELPVAADTGAQIFTGGAEPVVRANRAGGGALLGTSVEYVKRSSTLSMSDVPKAWYVAKHRSMIEGMAAEPFVVSYRPDTGEAAWAFMVGNSSGQLSSIGVNFSIRMESVHDD